MRPGRLGQIFDDAGDVIVAFDQQHVAWFQRLAQRVRIARRERLIAVYRPIQITDDDPPDSIEHPAHGASQRGAPWSQRSLAAFYSEGPCNLVHTKRACLMKSLRLRTPRRSGTLATRLKASGNHAATEPPLIPRYLCSHACVTGGFSAHTGCRRFRRCDCRRRCCGHRRGAPDRRRWTKVRVARSCRPRRRPLHHRNPHVSACPTTAAPTGSTRPISIR